MSDNRTNQNLSSQLASMLSSSALQAALPLLSLSNSASAASSSTSTTGGHGGGGNVNLPYPGMNHFTITLNSRDRPNFVPDSPLFNSPAALAAAHHLASAAALDIPTPPLTSTTTTNSSSSSSASHQPAPIVNASLNAPAPNTIYSAIYSGVPVYEMVSKSIPVMRRMSDSYLNATQILKVAGFSKPKRTKILEREVLSGEHEKIQGGYGKYQGTWIPLDSGRALARKYNVEGILSRLFDFDPAKDPVAPKPHTFRETRTETSPTRQAAALRKKSIVGLGVDGEALFSPTHSPTDHDGSGHTSKHDMMGEGWSPMRSPTSAKSGGQEGQRGWWSKGRPDTTPSRGTPGTPARLFPLHYGPDQLNQSQRRKELLLRIFLNDNPNGVLELLKIPGSGGNSGIEDFELDVSLDKTGATVLHWAASLGRMAIVDVLLKRGANPQITNVFGESALMRAVMLTNNSDAASFPILLDLLRDSWDMTDESQKSVLHHIAIVAGMSGKAESARYYAECFADWIESESEWIDKKAAKAFVDAKDVNGDSALHVASQVGDVYIVKQLLRMGADVRAENKSGVKPLDLAMESDSWRCVKAIRRKLSGYPVQLETTESDISDVSLTEDTASDAGSEKGEPEEESDADRRHRLVAGAYSSHQIIYTSSKALPSLTAMTAFNLREVLDVHLRARLTRHDDTIALATEELNATQKLLAESGEELERLRGNVGEIEAAKVRVEELELLMRVSKGDDEDVDGGKGKKRRVGDDGGGGAMKKVKTGNGREDGMRLGKMKKLIAVACGVGEEDVDELVDPLVRILCC
ncbi:hypothetical protein BJ742DRAFT_788137 [Cladochytrium replicatum]|nr:hypothetical protein BJ742DRAFT_788137 [Cladochytrium replicatum]